MTIAGTVLKTVGVFALAANLGQPAPSQDEPFPRQLLLDKLTAREDELAEALADLVVADGTADTSRQLELIDTALSSVGEQRNRLALEQAAWVAVDSTSVVSHRYVLDVAQLPTENELRAGLADGSPAKGVWGELRIMAVLPEYTPASDPHAELGQGYDAPIQDGASRSLWYRRPRPTRISIFRLDENDDIQPIRITETDVLDKHSRHFGLVLGDDGLFRDSELNVVIGGLGTPTAITTSHDSGLPDALAALAAAPKELTTGYSDAVKMQQVLAPADPQVAELDALRAEKTKLQLQADIAKLKKV